MDPACRPSTDRERAAWPYFWPYDTLQTQSLRFRPAELTRGLTVRKVVVTGMGCVSGLGGDKASTWESLVAGKSAIRATTVFPEGQRELSFSGAAAPVVTDALRNLAARYEEKQLNVDLFSNFAAAATLEALQDAGIYGDDAKLSDAAIIYGSASGGNAAMEAGYLRLFFSRLANVHPMTIPRLMASAGASHLSMLFGIRGNCLAISSACDWRQLNWPARKVSPARQRMFRCDALRTIRLVRC
jgi:acyl transferase domain-containing protein